MLANTIAWLDAARAALAAAPALAGVAVVDGPVSGWDNVQGVDLVICGHDDDDESGLGITWEGDWHDASPGAVVRGTGTVTFCLISQAPPAVTVAARRAAVDALRGLVRAVLFPSPAGSALGVAGVLWASEASCRLHQIPTEAGPVARVVMSVAVETLSA